MNNKGISNNGYIQNSYDLNKAKNAPAEKSEKKDKIEISAEAKVKQSSGKDLAAIAQKIKDGFYNSDFVINKTADAILKEINAA